jgi:hypothetical protein
VEDLLAADAPHFRALVESGIAVGYKSGKSMDAFQTLVAGFIISLDIQNLLEKKTRISDLTVPARASAFEVNTIYTSERNGCLVEKALESVVSASMGDKLLLPH